jgi:hypothetical protein
MIVTPTAFAWIHSCAAYPGYSVLPVTQSERRWGPQVGRDEDAGKERAEDSADRVHAEDVERIVGLDHLLEAADAPQADEARGNADHKGTGNPYVARSRRDRDEPRDRARRRTQHRRLALEDPFAERPTARRTPWQVRVHERERGRLLASSAD